MFFFNTHVPEFCYDQDFTALKPEDILGWARGKLLFKSNNCSQTKIKLENKIPLTIPAGLAPSLTFSIVNKNNVFAILCYIYSSL